MHVARADTCFPVCMRVEGAKVLVVAGVGGAEEMPGSACRRCQGMRRGPVIPRAGLERLGRVRRRRILERLADDEVAVMFCSGNARRATDILRELLRESG